jgi:hypothetical protein
VTPAPPNIELVSCGRRSCTGSRTVTVSASDLPTSPIATTTIRTTTTVGGCTYRTTTKQLDAEVAGTLTIDGTSLDETGFVSVVSETMTIHCR